MKLSVAIKSFLFAVLLIFIFYNSRNVFYYIHEPSYLEDWYYHSQWNIPSSARGMSDGPLYQFVGDRLVNGENPFNINFEIPPLGKYLYGESAKWLSNPYWFSSIIFLLSIFVFTKIVKELEVSDVLLTTILFISTPFISGQIKETMLDLPMMFFYLCHFYFFTLFLKNKGSFSILASGTFLGLATATKPGVYTPFVAFIGLLFIFYKSKKRINLLTYPASIFFGYVVGFFPTYFIRHPNPIPWIRLHERSIRFYLEPGGVVDHLSQLKTIFHPLSGISWFTIGVDNFGDWSVILPIGFILTLYTLTRFKKNSPTINYLAITATVFLFVNSLIHFWPRYLMSVVPVFLLLIAHHLKSKQVLLYLILFFSLISTYNFFTPNKVNGHIEAFARFFSTRANHEIYRTINIAQRSNINEDDFIKTLESFFETISVRDIKVQIKEIKSQNNTATATVLFTYNTKYGQLTHLANLNYKKENNEWRSVWSWDYLYPGYTPQSKIVINEYHIPFSKLVNSSGLTLAKRDTSYSVYKITRVMFNWGKDIDDLVWATGESPGLINSKIHSVVPDHNYRYLGELDPRLTSNDLEKVEQIPGVKIIKTEYLSLTDSRSKNSSKEIIEKLKNQRPDLFYMRSEAYIESSGTSIPLTFTGTTKKDVEIKIDSQGNFIYSD